MSSEWFIWQKGEKHKLTPSFSTQEFTCRGKTCGCTTQRISVELVKKLQKLRDEFGPIEVTSGYRCLKHNRSIGSKDTSQHVASKAADIRPNGFHLRLHKEYDLAKLTEAAEHLFNGIGIARNFCHVDVRGKKAKWKY